MAHARTQIREQIKAWLETVPEYAGHVQSGRSTNAQYLELPLLTIFAGDENSRVLDIAGSVLSREFQLIIEVKLKPDGTNVDDAMDAEAVRIESVISQERSFGTLWHRIDLVRTDPNIDDSGECVLGLLRMIYTVEYMTNAQDATQLR